MVHRTVAVRGVVVQPQLAQQKGGAIMLHHPPHTARFVFRGYLVPRLNDLHTVHGLVVLAHVVVALGGTGMVIEGDARADDVNERRALVP